MNKNFSLIFKWKKFYFINKDQLKNQWQKHIYVQTSLNWNILKDIDIFKKNTDSYLKNKVNECIN